MKTNEITKFFKKNQDTILVALGVIVILIVVWIIVKNAIFTGNKTKKKEIEDSTGQKVTEGLIFSDLAKRMFTAWISTIGTDEAEVYAILGQIKNQADWEYLKVAYEDYWNSLPIAEQLIHTTFGLGLSGVLVADFRRELNKRELQRCREILEGNNITPGF